MLSCTWFALLVLRKIESCRAGQTSTLKTGKKIALRPKVKKGRKAIVMAFRGTTLLGDKSIATRSRPP
jgi:hypothetical protein